MAGFVQVNWFYQWLAALLGTGVTVAILVTLFLILIPE